MNNGEGTRENILEVTSPDPFDSFPVKSDGGDVSPASLSQYSSCAESEFERYCSANSIMGTPSVRSSYGTSLYDCLDSEFESLKSIGFGDDISFENFSLGGNRKVSTLGDRRIGFREGINDEGIGLSGLYCDNSNSVEGIKDDDGMHMNISEIVNDHKIELVGSVENVLIQESGVNSEGGERCLIRNEIEHDADIESGAEQGSLSCINSEEKGSCSERSDVRFGSELKEMEGEEGGTSSRYEHSEDEDSMYNYGSDKDPSGNSYYPRNVEYVQEAKWENGNPLLINSHVAFGSTDWDDFEQEVGKSTLSSLTLEKFEERGEPNLENGKNPLGFTTKSQIGFPGGSQNEQGNDVTDAPVVSKIVQGADECVEDINHSTVTAAGVPYSSELEHVEEENDIPLASYQVQGAELLAENIKSVSSTPIGLRTLGGLHEGERDFSVTCNQVKGADLLEESTKISSLTPRILPEFSGSDQHIRDASAASNQLQGALDSTMNNNNNCPFGDFFDVEHDPLTKMVPLQIGLEIIDSGMHGKQQDVNNTEVSPADYGVLGNEQIEYFTAQLDPFVNFSIDRLDAKSTGFQEISNAELSEDRESKLSSSAFGNITNASKNSHASADLNEEHLALTKRGKFELNDFYDAVVHEMEEILLDCSDFPGTWFSQGNQMSQSQVSVPPRDGGSTASTSGTDDAYPLTPLPLRIDGVEVVGAKQKNGDVSLSERLVGVKEYTVYKIRVWSGKDQWEVERRYRDFFTLYCGLKSFFADQGLALPSPWSSVEKESRKLFGNASPDVVAHRSILIQECLQSIIHSSFFSNPPYALIRFLSPQESFPNFPASNTLLSRSTSFTRGADAANISTLGKTISLIVEIRPQKSMKQMLEAQHYTCAGCHKHFDDGMSLIQDFVHTFGWGRPRLCEYTGQLFCSSCHTNETAVLPARVLHHWDFTHYPVSQLAKSYLDSVYDQPMLCVSAVNPSLYSKVPALNHVTSARKKLGNMLPYVRCPFRRAIDKGLGSRRYLLESNDFFALRDLIDLSKGPFAALPVTVENVSRKILEHITEHCLICCDAGVPCCARQACDDPSSLIFDFQEGEIKRCKSCEAVFHKPCFRKITCCPCGASLAGDASVNSSNWIGHDASGEANGALTLLGKRGSGLSIGLLTGLFPKAKPEKTEHRDSSNVILMGSLPNTSL